ncbi:hypothetical protein LINGRAHAP2_LOCUS17577 [Linum grandiflorum]
MIANEDRRVFCRWTSIGDASWFSLDSLIGTRDVELAMPSSEVLTSLTTCVCLQVQVVQQSANEACHSIV